MESVHNIWRAKLKKKKKKVYEIENEKLRTPRKKGRKKKIETIDHQKGVVQHNSSNSLKRNT